MLSKLHDRLGTAGFVVAVVALIAVLAGTAYAAAKLNSTQKKEVEKIAKKFAKAGPTGPTGPAGPQGAKGEAGAGGKDGATGPNGTSVTNTTVSTAGDNGNCVGTGGSKFVGTSATYACNGQTGFTETLPSSKTETGAWSYGKVFYPGATAPINAAATFAIPLSAGVPGHLILANNQELAVGGGGVEEVTPTQCGAAVGGTAAEPKAAPGNFCMYIAKQTGTVALGAAEGSILESNFNILNPGSSVVAGGNTGTTGAILRIQLKATVAEPSPTSEGWGTWAATAP